MHYTSFRIRNFKGIRDTTIKLSGKTKTGVFAFVGLNESGKTTILEAIHSFSPDRATSEVVGGKGKGVPIRSRVPRHLISNFSDDVSVSATVRMTEQDRLQVIDALNSLHGMIVDPDSLPYEVALERQQSFKHGDFENDFFSLRADVRVKTKRQKKWRKPTLDEQGIIRDQIYKNAPNIAYFPTFVFDFPKRIFLTQDRGGKVSNFYREAFQDILDFEGSGYTIEESIVRRIRGGEKKTDWLSFLLTWNSGDDKDKVQHVMDRASATITEVIFGRWNKIFGEEVKGKEINISFETIEGEEQDDSGKVTKTEDHDLYIKFQIKDGTRRFDVNDRSLGFRWFFSFMMLTQFRVARENTRPLLFLFDEPASNLHAAAQQKLIDSFPEIAKGNHSLAYTTHSHYMVEPKWLEQTFIVTNRADAPDTPSVIDAISLSDESLDIQVTPYRKFVNSYPNQTSFFQPVLDRLEVVPSKFDIDRASIIVEGKSDYYVLRYAEKLLCQEDLPLLPGLGAGTFGSLIALHLGWGIEMIALLDGDPKGKEERDRYVAKFGLPREKALTLDDLYPDALEIEDILDDHALQVISDNLDLTSKPTKKQICTFFQEFLAKDEILPLGQAFEDRTRIVLDELRARLLKQEASGS